MQDDQGQEPEYSNPMDGAPPSGNMTVRMRFGIALGATLPVTILVLFFVLQLVIELIHWLLP